MQLGLKSQTNPRVLAQDIGNPESNSLESNANVDPKMSKRHGTSNRAEDALFFGLIRDTNLVGFQVVRLSGWSDGICFRHCN